MLALPVRERDRAVQRVRASHERLERGGESSVLAPVELGDEAVELDRIAVDVLGHHVGNGVGQAPRNIIGNASVQPLMTPSTWTF